MISISEHNSAIQQAASFNAADLEANKQGRYSDAQMQRFKSEREFFQQTSGKYENKSPLISLIFGMGLLFFCVVLYFVGVFDMLQSTLGSLFLPVLAGAGILAALFVFVIVPRSYQSSVDAYKSMGTSLAERPLGAIQTIEARAEAYKSQGGINRRGHQPSRISYVLQIEGIKFLITESLMNAIENKRLYRVYCVNDGGVWTLLSMEALE